MSEVACVFGPLLEEVRSRGVPPEKLVEGLGLAPEELGDPRHRIPWEAFTVLARRTSEILGDEGLGDVAARSAEQSLPGLVRRVLRRFGDPRPIYLIGARWWGPWFFRATRATCEQLADGRLREVIEILPEYRESPEFFRGVQALLRAMPRLFGLPDAVVELRHDGRRGEFIITPPPARRGARRFRRKTHVEALPEELCELGFQQEQLLESERRAHASSAMLAAKGRQLELLEELGLRLGQVTEVHEVFGSVVRLLEEKLSVRGVRLSGTSHPEAGEPAPLHAEAGDVSGVPAASLPLRGVGRDIGRLELWATGGPGLSEADVTRVGEIAPWIGIALASAQAAESVSGLVELLDADADDWRRVERSLADLLEPEELASRLHELGSEVAAHMESEAILLLEDDPALRESTAALFEQAGFEVALHGGDASRISPEEAHAALLVADWRRSLEPEFMRQLGRLQPELRGVLLLPLARL